VEAPKEKLGLGWRQELNPSYKNRHFVVCFAPGIICYSKVFPTY